MGICQPLQKSGVNLMRVKSAQPTNHEKGRTGKRMKKDADRLEEASAEDHKWVISWPRINIRPGL